MGGEKRTMTTEKQDALLRVLPARLDEIERAVKRLAMDTGEQSDLLKRLIYNESAGNIPLASEAQLSTIVVDVEITEDSSVLQFINPNGQVNVSLPAPGISNKWYIISNTSS